VGQAILPVSTHLNCGEVSPMVCSMGLVHLPRMVRWVRQRVSESIMRQARWNPWFCALTNILLVSFRVLDSNFPFFRNFIWKFSWIALVRVHGNGTYLLFSMLPTVKRIIQTIC
jgi:hypothetical protein